jgi:hypothetical protein
MDSDPGGPKTYRSCGSGSGSATLLTTKISQNKIKRTVLSTKVSMDMKRNSFELSHLHSEKNPAEAYGTLLHVGIVFHQVSSKQR